MKRAIRMDSSFLYYMLIIIVSDFASKKNQLSILNGTTLTNSV